jgi:hypothetical protein
LPFLLLAPVAAFMALNMLETALMRRRALAGMYLRPDSFLARLLCRQSLLTAWQLLKAVVLGLLLFLESPRWPSWLWAVLGLDLLLLGVLEPRVRRWLESQVRGERRDILARWLLLSVNTVLLVLVLAVAQLFLPRPDYTGLGWEDAALQAAGTLDMACDSLAPVVRLGAMRDALAEWLIQHLPLGGWLSLSAWLVYFVWSGLVFWAWSRLVLGALGAPGALKCIREGRCD